MGHPAFTLTTMIMIPNFFVSTAVFIQAMMKKVWSIGELLVFFLVLFGDLNILQKKIVEPGTMID